MFEQVLIKKVTNTRHENSLKYEIWNGQLFAWDVSEKLQKTINVDHLLPYLKIGLEFLMSFEEKVKFGPIIFRNVMRLNQITHTTLSTSICNPNIAAFRPKVGWRTYIAYIIKANISSKESAKEKCLLKR